MAVSNNLQRRSNGVYYLRVFIPSALVGQFGRREITRSLETTCRSQAERLAITMRAKAYGLMDMATKNPHLTKEELRQIAKRYFDRAMEKRDVEYLNTKFSPMERDGWGAEYHDLIERLDDDLDSHTFESVTVARLMEDICKHEGFDLAPSSHEYRQIAEVGLRAVIDVLRAQQSRLSGNFDPQPTDEILTAGLVKPTMSEGEGIAFTDLIDRFISENGKSWKPKTLEKHRTNLSLCCDILGTDIQVDAIDKAGVRKIKEILGQLPPNWTKRYRSMALEDVINTARDTGEGVLTPATSNAYLSSLSSLMAWADKQGYTNGNPVSGMLFPDPVKDKDKRDPFSISDLNRIFSAPIFTGMKSDHHWKAPGHSIIKNERYWIPLIALFTGMRLGEIVQLKGEDFKSEDGINFLDIGEAKTQAGVRRLPIHPELVSLGLLGHVSETQSTQPLFPGTSPDAYSKHFSRLLDNVGITDKKLVFHSFRHTFTDALRAAKVTEPITKALIGHSDGTVTGQYGSGYPLEVLYEELKRVDYTQLDLSHLIGAD